MGSLPATLLVIEGTDQGTRFLLNTEMVIGRGTHSPIRVLDTEASRTHCRIYPEKSRWYVSDLDSSNGTFVNGQQVSQAVLESGDHLRVGRTTLVFAVQQPTDSSLLSVDLIGGSSQHGHSQILQTFRPEDDQSENRSSDSIVKQQEELKPEDILQVMSNIAEQAVRPSITLTDLLERVLRLILHTVHGDRGCILLVDDETGMVVPQASLNRPGTANEYTSARMPVSKSIVDYVMKTGQSVRSSDPLHDTRFDPGQSILQAGVREALCVPMQGRMKLLGAIYLDVTDRRQRQDSAEAEEQQRHLTDRQLRLLTAVARQCALAIENFRYQQSLVDAERLAAIGQTIATLSHHIKNILQGVRGGSYLIDMGLRQDERDLILKGWKLVEKNQDKIYNLVMDMLTFSKERTPTIEYADLNEVAHDVFELMEKHAEDCRVGFTFLPDASMPHSSFDPDGLHRAILNIVTNAIDAAEEAESDGRVSLSTQYDSVGHYLMVRVTDNGPGIAKDQKEKIFNVFESNKGSRGTGIGLAVSRKILQEHGGDIEIESEPGAGASFVLFWPYSNEAAGQATIGG